jgi:hypothetical protein
MRLLQLTGASATWCDLAMQSDVKLVCKGGCQDWNADNYNSEDCKNGESASKALVMRPTFLATTKGKLLEKAMAPRDGTDSNGNPETNSVPLAGGAAELHGLHESSLLARHELHYASSSKQLPF